MRALTAVLPVTLCVALSLNSRHAAADDSPAPESPRFEGGLRLKLPKTPLAAVVIEGNSQIKTAEILKRLKTKAGRAPDSLLIKDDVRSLYSLRWFSDVEARVDQSQAGPVLTFIVKEKPPLEKIHFAGNAHIEDQKLLEIAERCGLKAPGVYDAGVNIEAARNLQEHYRATGYLHARVELEKRSAPDSREVVFKIDEGPLVVVMRVSFSGNKLVDAMTLKRLLRTTTRDIWSSDGRYYPETIPDDLEALHRFYQDRGFFDAQLKHHVTFSTDRSAVHVQFSIDEGVPYKVRMIEIGGNESIDEATLRQGLLLCKDRVCDRRLMAVDEEMILARYAQLGYVSVKVVSRTRCFEEPGYADVIYEISEGERLPIGGPDVTAKGNPREPARSNGQATVRSKPRSQEPRGMRDPERIVFTGLKTFSVADLRDALDVDFDTALAAHPRGSLDKFGAVLKQQILAGYQHAGFPDASVEVVFHSTKGQTEVRIAEGGRFDCGEIQVDGAPQAMTQSIIRDVSNDAKPKKTLWKQGVPVPFDEFTAERIHDCVAAVFAREGFFAPEFDVEIGKRPESHQADLKVRVRNTGRPAAVGKIEIIGSHRDSPDDVMKYLDLQPGMRYDSELATRLKKRLWESGVYLKSHVSAKVEGPDQPVDVAQVYNLKVKLEEYERAPALVQKRSPTDQALLKCREWLEKWAHGEVEEDLVLTASTYPLEVTPPGARLGVRMVVAPDRGQTIELVANGPDGKPMTRAIFVASPDRMVLAAPDRREKIEFPNTDGLRLALGFTGRTLSRLSRDDDTEPFGINVGIQFRRKASLKAAALGVELDLYPAFMLAVAHFETSRSEFHNGICTVRAEGYEVQIDASSGQLLDFQYADKAEGATVSIRTAKQALKAELARLEPALAASKVAYDKASPWKSLVAFCLDCWFDATVQGGLAEEGNAVRVLRKLVDRWSPPALAPVLEIWDGPLDRTKPEFVIPPVPLGFAYEELDTPGSRSRKNLVGSFILPVCRRVLPKTGWLWPVGRDAALAWAQEEGAPDCVAETCESPEIGPVGELLLGTFGPFLGRGLRERAGIAGIAQLSVEAFHKDYEALLKEDSWMGRWFTSVVVAVQSLDSSELKALERFLPASVPQELLVSSLRTLKADPRQPVGRILPGVLDRMWSEALRVEVSARLRHFVEVAALRRERTQRESQARSASGDESPPKR